MWLFAVCFRYYHVIFNLMIQLLLGIPLEMVHKGVRIGIVYILGVIAGEENTCAVGQFVLKNTLTCKSYFIL